MMARRGVLGLMAGGASMLGGCGLSGEDRKYRFRTTIEVETPRGARSGSSTYEVKAFGTRDLITGGKGSRTEVKGEAVAVDLPGGRTLFALLKTTGSPGHDDLAFMSMKALDPEFNYNRVDSAKRIASGDGARPSAEVPPSDYPMLVTFRDIDDPTSVERVDFANLAAAFGSGYSLRRIAVEVTDEPVNTGIEKRLGWLLDKNRKRFDPNKKPQGIPLGNYGGLFSTEISQ